MSAPGSPPLETARLRLRPVEDADLEFVFDLATAPATGWRWRWRGYVPTREDIVRDLAGDALLVFVIDDKRARERIGLLHAYGVSLHDRFAYVGAIVGEPYIGSGWGAEGFLLFANYLFTIWDLRKLYVEMPEFNVAQFASAQQELFEVEGTLKAHQFYDGRYWDKHTWALYRERWEQFGAPLVERLRA